MISPISNGLLKFVKNITSPLHNVGSIESLEIKFIGTSENDNTWKVL